MSRSEKIAGILARRADLARSIEVLDEHVFGVSLALSGLDAARCELTDDVESDARARFTQIGEAIHGLDAALKRERTELGRLVNRLNRSTLNVGMVGLARVGKSRFLQSLTGLGPTEIPDGNGGFCTGAPSLVLHSTDATPRVEVFLHNETSFLQEVIGPYFESLGLGRIPHSVEEFAGKPLPPMPSGIISEARYQHLAAYHRHFPEYRVLLRQQSRVSIEPDQIPRFVAQYNRDRTEEYHNFRAVRRVEIHTPLTKTEVDRLGVVDLPGLGDTNLGDETILLNALKDDVDVILFVRKPAASGDDIHEADYTLYETVQNALPNIPLGRSAFLILNRHQDNLANCLAYRAKLAGSPIRLVDSWIVDCADPDEVGAAFDAMADHLLSHATELDDLLLADRHRSLAELQQQLGALIEDASGLAVLTLPTSTRYPLFVRLFNRVHEELSQALVGLVRELEDQRTKPDPEFGDAVREVLESAARVTGLPTTEEIEARRDRGGGVIIAYAQFLNEARAHLSRQFLELDTVLAQRVAWMQQRVATVLSEHGRLDAISQSAGRELLVAVVDRVPSLDNEIRYGLRMLADFELSYRGFIQHRVRPCLDGLHGDHPTYPLKQADRFTPARMLEALEVTYEGALDKCRQALESVAAEPNGALFAIVRGVQ